MTGRYNVAILGASGLVGQRLQDLLYDHPMFRVVAIAGSPNSVGLMHEEIEWRLETPRPRYDILICSMSDIPDVDIAFSALPNNVAEVVEPSLVARGIHVFSNASTFPVVTQIIGLKDLGIVAVTIHTRQALSGAGWRLLFDEEALSGNVNPLIPGEEEKLIAELKYLLGMDIPVIASCNRVSEKDGHFVSCGVEVSRKTSLEEVQKLMQIPTLNLPSSPDLVNNIIDE